MAVKRVGEVQSKPQVPPVTNPMARIAALRSAAPTVSGFDDPRRAQPIALKPETQGERPATNPQVAELNGIDRLRFVKLKP